MQLSWKINNHRLHHLRHLRLCMFMLMLLLQHQHQHQLQLSPPANTRRSYHTPASIATRTNTPGMDSGITYAVAIGNTLLFTAGHAITFFPRRWIWNFIGGDCGLLLQIEFPANFTFENGILKTFVDLMRRSRSESIVDCIVQELENPLILIHEKKISNFNSLVKAFDIALKSQSPLLIVSEDVESEVLATVIVNKLCLGLKVCAIKAPGFGENRKNALEDLAVITGGQVINEELGLNPEKVDTDWLGSWKNILDSSTCNFW